MSRISKLAEGEITSDKATLRLDDSVHQIAYM